MRTPAGTLLTRLPIYMAFLLVVACTTPGPSEPDTIKPIVNVIDEDLQNVGGFDEQTLLELLTAEIAGSRGQLEYSVQRYLEIAQTTRDTGIIERATRIALYAEDNDAARQAATLWLEIDPQSPSAHQIMGTLALQSGNEEAALRHFRTIIAEPGPLPPKLWLIIGALQRIEDSDDIIRIMDEVMRDFNANNEIMLNYANVLMRLKKFDQAAAIYETLITGSPPSTEALRARLAIFEIAGIGSDAEQWLKEMLLATEGDMRRTVRLHYSQILAQTGKLVQAIDQLEILIDEEPDRGEALLSAGVLYLEVGRNAEAMHAFQALLEQEAFVHEASYFLGWLAEQQDDTEKARQWYGSVPSGPRYPLAQIRLAVLQASHGELEQARLKLLQIYNESPAHRNQAIQAEAELLVNGNRQEEALQVYDRAIGDGYNSELLYARALLAEKSDRLDLLESDLRKIVEREPDNAQALNALGYTLADKTNRYDEAYGLIKRALLLNPHNFYIIDSMGWVLYRLGRLEESAYYLRRSLDIKFDPVAAAHLAEVLWAQGKRREAQKFLNKAGRLFPDDETVQDTRTRLQ